MTPDSNQSSIAIEHHLMTTAVSFQPLPFYGVPFIGISRFQLRVLFS